MRGLRATLFKDLRLFLRGSGLLALLLPLFLLPALRWGMGDLAGQSYVRAFPVAVRDLDQTLMSRSLINQLSQIQIFSQVESVPPESSDEDALSRGAAAVVTIPKDFFYELYTMDDCPVTVTLNRDMALESALLESIITSVMDIVRADQAAYMGAYRLAYGELTPQLNQSLYADTAQRLFTDALGRQQVFSQAAQATDLAAGLERHLLACVLAVSAIFFALSAVKTLPEEIALGILPRFQAAGSQLGAFIFSKLCVAFLLTLPVLLLAAALLPGLDPWFLLLLELLLLLAAFGILSAVAAWTGNAQTAQRWGNILLLLSLATGGTLWPRNTLPAALRWIGRLTLPYYASLGLDARAGELDFSASAALLWPLAAMAVLGLAVALPGFRRRRQGQAPVGGNESAAPLQGPPSLTGFSRRLAALSRFKLLAASGGRGALAVTLAAGVLCGLAAAGLGENADTLHIAVCDLDDTDLSRELAESIGDEAGVSVVSLGLDRARQIMLIGEIEGILIIDEGYAAALTSDIGGMLRYESAEASVAAQGAREIAAGKASAQRSRLMSEDIAAGHMGRALTPEERTRLREAFEDAVSSLPPLYTIAYADGAGAPDPFVPGCMSFAALAALFTLLTAASWFGTAEARRAERRMAVLQRGRLLSFGSDCLALTALGLIVMLAVLLPGGIVWSQLPAAAAYALTAAAMSLTLARVTALAGRVDALAPFLALLLCLFGGCFVDLSGLSPAMAAASLLSPAGLAVRGTWSATVVLLAEAALLFFAGMPRVSSRKGM